MKTNHGLVECLHKCRSKVQIVGVSNPCILRDFEVLNQLLLHRYVVLVRVPLSLVDK